jgi:tRNA dimethylallyltransferase
MINRAVLIAGPTASGKSALALRLAAALGGVVVNADSMQVYSDLRIITARPSRQDEAQVAHALYGHVDGAVNYSAGQFARDAAPLLQRLAQEGHLPIITGGTGLYFKALTDGLSQMPVVPDEVRHEVRALASGRSAPDLHAELAGLDPATAASLKPGDNQRILRALEVMAASGHPPRWFHERREPGPLAGWQIQSVFLDPPREGLHKAINARFDSMMVAGALDEVAQLASRGLDPALPVMRAHGVPALIAHLQGDMALDDAIARGQADTRAYVKRQFTWFRHQMPGFQWVDAKAAEAVIAAWHAGPRSGGDADFGPQ